MKVAIIGATGFIGQSLIRQLLDQTDHTLIAFSKSADKLPARDRLERRAGNLLSEADLTKALQGCDAAVYLVHMMGSRHDDYAKLETDGAHSFVTAARAAGLPRTVFLGGLGDDRQQLSKHLASRQHTGAILRAGLPLVIELRASMVIGDGSVGYEIIKAIARKLPILAIPRWTVTPTQPIALHDVLSYIQAALTVKTSSSRVVGIGGPDVLTYPQILERYSAWAGHRQHVFKVPLVPRWAATWWLKHFMPAKVHGIGKPMVDSLHYAMVVPDDTAQKLFPDVKPVPIEQAFGD